MPPNTAQARMWRSVSTCASHRSIWALPNTATAQELLNACAARGGADQDHAAMVRALEILADHPVA